MAKSGYRSTERLDRLVRSAVVAKDYEDAASRPVEEGEGVRVAKKWTKSMAHHFRARFATRLRELREEARLSLNELGRKAGVDHSQLVRLEAGERSCTLETAVKIAGALGVTLGILTDETSNHPLRGGVE